MDKNKKILELTTQMGIVRPRDVEQAGISREYLRRLFLSGELVRVSRGLYALPSTLTSEFSTLAEVAKRAPNAVICLLTALRFHNLTTQAPHQVWIAIENKQRKPKFDYPPIELFRFTGLAFSFGVKIYTVNSVEVRVYSPAKTVADCFKFRNKIGLDVAIEALRETWRSKKTTMDELWEASKVCRVSNVMRPYLESIV